MARHAFSVIGDVFEPVRAGNYIIREATPSDLFDVIALGRRFHESTQYATLIELNDVAMQDTVLEMVTRPGLVILVAQAAYGAGAHRAPVLDGTLVAMIGLASYRHPLSGVPTAAELFWWVDPAHRGSLGVRLLREAERWATGQGYERLQMIAPTEEVERLYRARGYTRVEVTYHKDLKRERL